MHGRSAGDIGAPCRSGKGRDPARMGEGVAVDLFISLPFLRCLSILARVIRVSYDKPYNLENTDPLSLHRMR